MQSRRRLLTGSRLLRGTCFLSGFFLLGLDLLDERNMLLGGQPSLVHDFDLPDPSSHEQYDCQHDQPSGTGHETEISKECQDFEHEGQREFR